MDDYKEVLFKSMLLVQGVEGLVRDCILKLVAKGQIERSDIELEKIKNVYGLGGLAYAIKPAVTEDMFGKLIALSQDRNDVAHRAANDYLMHILSRSAMQETEMDHWKLKSVTEVAGDIFGELLDLHESLCN
jgi:hypothetical protein